MASLATSMTWPTSRPSGRSALSARPPVARNPLRHLLVLVLVPADLVVAERVGGVGVDRVVVDLLQHVAGDRVGLRASSRATIRGDTAAYSPSQSSSLAWTCASVSSRNAAISARG